MYWLWRAMISLAVAAIACPPALMLIAHLVPLRASLMSCLMAVLAPGVALTVYMMLTSWRTTEYDVETRCRKCSYILRGISEPRCPECGERI